MTENRNSNRARRRDIHARMAATGDNYTTAMRAVDAAAPPDPAQPGDILIATCDGCGLVVDDGHGYLVVDVVAADDRRHRREKPDADKVASVDPVERLIGSPRVPWQVTHTDCLPEMEYEIEIAQVRTLRQLVDFTAHLMEKVWLQDTTWRFLLRDAVAGKGPLHLAHTR